MTNMPVTIGVLLLTVTGYSSASQPVTGKLLYEQSCLVCHGEDGSGAMPGVADLTSKVGALEKTDELLAKSIRLGVQAGEAAIAMPAKGGNPSLTESDIEKIIQYMRKEF